MRDCPRCGAAVEAMLCPADKSPTLRVASVDTAAMGRESVLDDRYELGGLIGKGALGRVYRAFDRAERRDVAIKVLNREAAAGAGDVVARFVREVATTAALRSPHTVAMYDYGRTSRGEFFAVMELLSGESLYQRLERFAAKGRSLPSSEVYRVAASVLDSLLEAHELGLIHRDVKPDNIVFHRVGNDEIVKLIDFGLVQVPGSKLTGYGARLGTPHYMSPEQVAGGQLDARSDLYALGCVLYACFAGAPPFSDVVDLYRVMQMQVVEEPRPLVEVVPTIEAPFAALIHRCLGKRVQDRFKDAAEMADALRALPVQASYQRSATSLTGPKLPKRPVDPWRQVHRQDTEGLAASTGHSLQAQGTIYHAETAVADPAMLREAAAEIARRLAQRDAERTPPKATPKVDVDVDEAPTETMDADALPPEEMTAATPADLPRAAYSGTAPMQYRKIPTRRSSKLSST
jgi:serine/threonine protein kinase